MPKRRKKAAHSPAATMTTAEGVAATLIGHGLDTIYALPGVRTICCSMRFTNSPTAAYRPHPPRTGRRLHGARRGTRHRQAASLRGGAGAWAIERRRGAAHGLCHQCAGARTDRANPRSATSGGILASCMKSATRLASWPGWLITPRYSKARTGLKGDGAGAARHAQRPRPGRPLLECSMDVWGKCGPGDPANTIAGPR